MATSQKSPISIKVSELAAPLRQAKLAFGREICGSLDIAEQREWLVTNGIGGFASGTVSGNLTRRYHGHRICGCHKPLVERRCRTQGLFEHREFPAGRHHSHLAIRTR